MGCFTQAVSSCAKSSASSGIDKVAAQETYVGIFAYIILKMLQRATGGAGVMDIPNRRKPYTLFARYHPEALAVSVNRLRLAACSPASIGLGRLGLGRLI